MSTSRAVSTFPFLRAPPTDDKGWGEEFGRLLSLLKWIADPARYLHTCSLPPVLVVNRDTIDFGIFPAFVDGLKSRGEKGLLDHFEIVFCRAVDTCQMWILGLDKALEGIADDDYIVHIPGDLRDVGDRGADRDAYFTSFISALGSLWTTLARADLVIGDFDAPPFSSKALIDTYGIFPLLMTWFPDVARTIREECGIERPRSEFFAARAEFLRAMLLRRKFAYEQSLNFLIAAILDTRRWRIMRCPIGKVSDDGRHRGFLEAVNQVERTERLLRVLWRESKVKDFTVTEFERHDRRSTAVREAAMVVLENYLAPASGLPKPNEA